MIALPYAVILALASALIGGAVSWGALRSTVATLRELVGKVEIKVDSLAKLELTLTRVDTELAHHKSLLEALQRWRESMQHTTITGQHNVAKG